jgi:transcription initiation factor TFIIH subunit 4
VKTLATKEPEGTGETGNNGFIIIETNYRLYAYTSSSLQISLLSLFVKILYQMPNLVMGVLTRESVRAALLNGITANQV